MALIDNALTTVDAVKEYLKITVATYDSQIEQLINSVSALIKTFCDRKFGKNTYTEKIKGNSSTVIIVYEYPIIEISSIKVDDEEITDYELEDKDKEIGIIYRESCWNSKYLYYGIIPEVVDRLRNIEIEYTAGYVLPKDDLNPDARNLPHDLEDICFRIIADYFNNLNFSATEEEQSKNLSKFSISDVTWDFGGGVKVQQLNSLMKNYYSELSLLGYKRIDF